MYFVVKKCMFNFSTVLDTHKPQAFEERSSYVTFKWQLKLFFKYTRLKTVVVIHYSNFLLSPVHESTMFPKYICVFQFI